MLIITLLCLTGMLVSIPQPQIPPHNQAAINAAIQAHIAHQTAQARQAAHGRGHRLVRRAED
jgi:hypothetical protein